MFKHSVAVILITLLGIPSARGQQPQPDRQVALIELQDKWLTVSGAGERSFQTFEGKYQRAISHPDFFQKVGRPDLALRERRRWIAVWSMLGGAAVALTGGILAGALWTDPNDANYRQCRAANRDDCRAPTTIGGDVLGVLGLAATLGLLVGTLVVLARPPVRPDQARQLADEHNRKLIHELGLDVPPARPRPAQVSPEVTLGAAVSPSFGGLRLAVSY